MGIPAKCAVVCFASPYYDIVDPNDAGMLSMVGFDTSALDILGEFLKN